MPKTIKTQTFTVTLSSWNLDHDLEYQLFDVLEDLRQRNYAGFAADPTGLSYTVNAVPASAVKVEEIETDSERSQREAAELTAQREVADAAAAKRQRDLKLLELKGWLYGEHLKKEAGLPSEWDQTEWGRQTACGTSACIAGKTVLDAGGQFVKLIDGENWNDPDTFRDPEPDEDTAFSWVCKPDGSTVKIMEWARDLLGLDDTQRSALFEGDNTYAMAAAVIDAIIDGTDVYDARNNAGAA